MGQKEGNLEGMSDEMREQRSSATVDVFHFTLSTPHFLEIGATFDFDTRTALKQIEMFLLPHQFMHAAESLPQRQ